MSAPVRQFAMALLSILFVLGAGTAGYMLIEQWPFEDSFFMTVITVTTVGYQEVGALSPAGRYFTVVLILTGFGIVAYHCTQIAHFVIQGELAQVFGERKMKQRIAELRKHTIVCGYGRMGQTVCDELARHGTPLVVIESEDDLGDLARDENHLILRKDAVYDDTLVEAGIKHARALVSVVSRDADNLLITLSARELNHKLHIVSRGESPDIETKMLRAGADVVISPFRLSGKHVAEMVRGTAAPDAELSAEAASVEGYQLRVIHSKTASTVGAAAAEANALQVVALKKENGDTLNLPDAGVTVGTGDELVILAHTAPLMAHEKENTAPQTAGARLLLADDHDALRKLFAKKLRKAGYDVIDVPTGTAALEAIRENTFDLIVLDAMMPGRDGFQICREIKDDEALKDTPVVIFSASNVAVLQDRSKEAGADAALEKTASSDELMETVGRLLRGGEG